MNRIDVKITDINTSGGVILVDMEANNFPMSALLIDIEDNPEWLKRGNTLKVVFKESEVSIAKNLSGNISLRNKLPCIVKDIERGKLLSVVILDFKGKTIHAAITSRSVDSLELKPGNEVLALIKANELALMQ